MILALLLLTIAGFAGAQEVKVSAVQVDGNSRIETSKIMGVVGIEPGDVVSGEELDNALQRIFALGSFDDIRVELTEVQGAKAVTFVVRELPVVRRFKFSGNDEFSETKLRKLVKIKIPSIYNRNKVEGIISDIKTAYIEDGYHAAKIVPKLKIDDKNEAALTFEINEGEKVLIREIKFVGNAVLDDGDLSDKMETQEKWFLSWITDRGTYDKEILEIDIERIKAAYQDIGYQDVKVKPAEVSLINDEYFDVIIEIDEGPQYRVGKIGVSGDLMRPQEQLVGMVSLKPGGVYSRAKLRESIETLTDLYANSGYANVDVAPLTRKDKKLLLIDITLDVAQGVKVFIERIDIMGNDRTRDKVIRREIPLSEGAIFSARGLKETKRRVTNLGYFDEVNVTKKTGSEENKTVVGVEVAERPTGTFSIGLGYSSADRLMAQGSVSQDNFMGYGVRLELSGSFGSSSTTYSLGVSDPHYLDTEWTVGGQIYKTEKEYDEYDDHRMGGSLRAGHPVSLNSKLYLTYRYEQQEILNVSPFASVWVQEQEGESLLSSITTEWIHNNTDFYQDPTSGGITKATVEYAGLGGTEDFIKTIVDHRHFFPLFWGTVFSIRGELGHVASTIGDEVSVTERFYLGGIKTIRGFKNREVGPTDGFGNYIGGEKMGFFNFEYLFPISKSYGLQGVLFYDIGNVWLEDEGYFTDMRSSVGGGVRWRSPMGPLRFEWGYNLDKREDEEQSVFEFTIGKAF